MWNIGNPPMLYLDHNAKAPLSPAARQAWLHAQETFPANPASPHRLGQRAETALEKARESVAAHLSCSPADLVWTSGATESAASVFAHLAHESTPGAEVWISALEHPCVREAALRFFPGRVRELPGSPGGVLEVEALASWLKGGVPAAVALMAANNETGVLQPWRAVRALCAEARVPFLCDATQWLGRLPADGLADCDYLFASAQKCGGPVGTGFLKLPRGLRILRFHPLLCGGAQEEGRRAGTQNLPGAAALAAALEDCSARFHEISARVAQRIRLEERLNGSLPGMRILGAGEERLWNTLALVPPPLADCRQRWVVRLDAAGVAVSSGSACASGREKASPVLEAMGVDAESAGRALRLSGGWETASGEWEEAVDWILRIYERFGPGKR